MLPLPLGSADVKIPRELRAGFPIRDEEAKQALHPSAGSLTLQGAGAKLRAIPGFSEAMEEQRVTGIGALQRFLDPFPECVVEGRAPKASVKLA